LSGNEFWKWRIIPGQGETKGLVPNMMYLGRKTLILKLEFKANYKANLFQAKCEWIRKWM